jgi:ceramide glucosyltransferase
MNRVLVLAAIAGVVATAALAPHLPLAAAVATVVGALVMVDVVRVDSILRRAIARSRRPAPSSRRYPSVSVIRPVRGRDVGAFENFLAALDTGYPGEVETLFVFDDESDPGLPVAHAAIAAHKQRFGHGRASIVIAGAPRPGRTGKLNAMIVGVAHARGELIAFGDSDTRPDQTVLRGLVDALLTTPRAGSAFAPVVVPDVPRGAGDVLYALMQNGLYSPWAAHAAGDEHTLPFIMGQFMVFRREALDDIGGVAAAEGQLVDDMYLGRRVHGAGWKNVMSRQPLRIATGGLTTRTFWPIYRRWMQFSRNGLPFSFTWPQWLIGVEFFAAAIATLVALGAGATLAALVPLAALAALAWHLLEIQEEYGGARVPLRWWWTPFLLIFGAPLIVVGNLLRPQIDWRGRAYRLGHAATLAKAAALLLALTAATASAEPLRLEAPDAHGAVWRVDGAHGRPVAIALTSRYSRREAERVNARLEPLAGRQATIVCIVDFGGIPSLFHGYARRKIAEAAAKSPIVFLVDERSRLRDPLAVHPDKRVDILVLDGDGQLRGHFEGASQLDAAMALLESLAKPRLDTALATSGNEDDGPTQALTGDAAP